MLKMRDSGKSRGKPQMRSNALRTGAKSCCASDSSAPSAWTVKRIISSPPVAMQLPALAVRLQWQPGIAAAVLFAAQLSRVLIASSVTEWEAACRVGLEICFLSARTQC